MPESGKLEQGSTTGRLALIKGVSKYQPLRQVPRELDHHPELQNIVRLRFHAIFRSFNEETPEAS